MTRRFIILPAMLALTTALAGCKQETQAPEPIRPVLSVLLEPAAAEGTLAVGSVEPRYKADLGFRVQGRLIARGVNVGDHVSEGQTIASIDTATFEQSVRSARAELQKGQAQLVNARATEQRQRTLITSDATTKATLDNAEQMLASAEAAVARAEANLTKAQEQLGYAQLQSDFDGIVTAVSAEVGQVVSPGQTVVTVARPDIREAVVDIGADFPVPLKVGLPFTVSLQLLPAVQIKGKIREIAPEADSVTRTRRVRISLSNPPPSFRLGSTVTATLANDQTTTLRLPASAVLSKDGETFVWVVDLPASTVSLRKVALFQSERGIEVTGGLDAGVRIVTAGIHSLKPGQRVRIDQDSKS